MITHEDKKRVYCKCVVCGKPFSYKKGSDAMYTKSRDFCWSCIRHKTPIKVKNA